MDVMRCLKAFMNNKVGAKMLGRSCHRAVYIHHCTLLTVMQFGLNIILSTPAAVDHIALTLINGSDALRSEVSV